MLISALQHLKRPPYLLLQEVVLKPVSYLMDVPTPIDTVEKTSIETCKAELKDTMIKIVPIPSNSQMAIEVLRWVKLRVSSKEYST